MLWIFEWLSEKLKPLVLSSKKEEQQLGRSLLNLAPILVWILVVFLLSLAILLGKRVLGV